MCSRTSGPNYVFNKLLTFFFLHFPGIRQVILSVALCRVMEEPPSFCGGRGALGTLAGVEGHSVCLGCYSQ